jgi:very-short-patch-repair endonuclease
MLPYIGLFLFIVGTIVILGSIKPIGTIQGTDWNQRKKCDSGAERKLFDALARYNFCILTQVPIGKKYRIDLFLSTYDLAIEVDSIFHDNPEAQARDRHKDKLIRDKGWQVIRVRAEDIDRDIESVTTRIIRATDWREELQPVTE